MKAIGFTLTDVLQNVSNGQDVKVFFRNKGANSWQEVTAAIGLNQPLPITLSGLVLNNVALELLVVERLITMDTSPIISRNPDGPLKNQFTFNLNPLLAPTGATSFQIEVRSIDASGTNSKDSTSIVPIGSLATISLANNQTTTYRIKVYSGTRLIANRSDFLPGVFDTNYSNAQEFPNLRWNLLAVPYSPNGIGDTAWIQFKGQVPLGFRDSVSVRTIGMLNGKEDFISVNPATSTHRPGDAILIAAAKSMGLRWSANQEPHLDVIQIAAPTSGSMWKLLGLPFIFPFNVQNVVSNKTVTPLFLALTYTEPIHAWLPATTTLNPYYGFAYHFQPGEVLTFDPFFKGSNAVPKRASEKSFRYENSISANPRLVFYETQSSQSVYFMPNGNASDEIPWLPTPGARTDIRVGSVHGYLRKAFEFSSLQSLPVHLKSLNSGKVKWEFNPGGWPAKALLVDSVQGLLYHSGDSLVLPQGEKSLSLWIGAEEELAEKEKTWKVGAAQSAWIRLPSVIRANQSLILRYQWNVEIGKTNTELSSSITKLNGSQIHRDFLKPMAIGNGQWMSSWKPEPGVYWVMIRVNSLSSRPVQVQKLTVLP